MSLRPDLRLARSAFASAALAVAGLLAVGAELVVPGHHVHRPGSIEPNGGSAAAVHHHHPFLGEHHHDAEPASRPRHDHGTGGHRHPEPPEPPGPRAPADEDGSAGLLTAQAVAQPSDDAAPAIGLARLGDLPVSGPAERPVGPTSFSGNPRAPPVGVSP